ncbi:alpha/beta hydrolase [Bradyrhizobium brasilense]|uniref:alpha/beta hydrolase family protein n=1 Tax=Bradyrhizobium brasilense TaxID=1419277 RepID=UPI0024B1A1B9|nr:alpha/beta hydrolase [Bradyrhizobium australafricanum]WFU31368.1 alpha/beta hydrolase [Bradyrhizobium australafricanum]
MLGDNGLKAASGVLPASDLDRAVSRQHGGRIYTTGTNWMECAVAWPHLRGDLTATRRCAAVFLDNLEEIYARQNWVSRWTNIGDANCLFADLNIKKGAFEKATEAWLCALTAFEIVRRLIDEDDPRIQDISAKIEAGVLRLGLSLERQIERVRIAWYEQSEFPAYYLPAGSSDLNAPAVICISREQETGATLLGRLLPLLIGRCMSVLVLSRKDISALSRGQSETMLSCCLDYLSRRPDVDARRIGVYGEGLSAVLATDFAVSDQRVAAAVCDGGLWNWARILASVGWRAGDGVDEEAVSARRSRLVRQLRCPVLVIAGGRGTVSVSEAIKLQADCAAARIALELAIPRLARTPAGEMENFVTSDDFIFGWLRRALADAPW